MQHFSLYLAKTLTRVSHVTKCWLRAYSLSRKRRGNTHEHSQKRMTKQELNQVEQLHSFRIELIRFTQPLIFIPNTEFCDWDYSHYVSTQRANTVFCFKYKCSSRFSNVCKRYEETYIYNINFVAKLYRPDTQEHTVLLMILILKLIFSLNSFVILDVGQNYLLAQLWWASFSFNSV